MSEVPSGLKYTKTDEWIRLENNELAVLGITDFAQEQLGDMVYVEMPDTGVSIDAAGECGVVESVKTANDIYLPVAGEIVAINTALSDSPEAINSDPYGDGWIIKFKPVNVDELNALLDAEAYQSKLQAEDH